MELKPVNATDIQRAKYRRWSPYPKLISEFLEGEATMAQYVPDRPLTVYEAQSTTVCLRNAAKRLRVHDIVRVIRRGREIFLIKTNDGGKKR